MSQHGRGMSLLTVVVLCSGLVVSALVSKDIGHVSVIAAVSFGMAHALVEYKEYWRFCAKLLLPNLAVLLGLNYLAALLTQHPGVSVVAERMQFATFLCSKLFIFGTCMFISVTAGRTKSFTLELESRGISPTVSYILGMSVRAPSLLIEEVSNIINGYRARGLNYGLGIVGRFRSLFAMAMAFLRISLVDSQSRALSLDLKNFFSHEKTRRPRVNERKWEPAFRYATILCALAYTAYRFLWR